MFIDYIKIKLAGGPGGHGITAYRREKYLPKGGPSGGNGGPGGSIVLEASKDVFSLDVFSNKASIFAEKGKQGGKGKKQGAKGKDLVIKVPLGTLVRDYLTKTLLYDFTHDQARFIICQGGKGGLGNAFFKTAVNQTPTKSTLGKPGESKEVEIELKLLADVGLIGFPSAGKSTLLTKIAPIKVKTAAYPFTTLKPNMSFIEFDDFSRIYLADIPGIIANAHQNRGLGLSFLRHIERCSTLIYVIDCSGIDGRNPYDDFVTLRHEIRMYNPQILEKSFLVALNKMDTQAAKKRLHSFKKRYPFPSSTLFEISALNEKGLTSLVTAMRTLSQIKGKKYF